MKITEVVTKKSGDIKMVALRYSGLQILVLFSSSSGYETLGKCFLNKEIEEIHHLKLTEIQGKMLCLRLYSHGTSQIFDWSKNSYGQLFCSHGIHANHMKI